MRKSVVTIFAVAASAMASSAFAQGTDACAAGVYHSGEQAVILARHGANEGMSYLFLDGRAGKTSDADNPLRCRDDSVMTRSAGGAFMVWRKVDLKS
ncbi:MAG TPA: hypothetical protein VMS78_01230 [Rhizomicrobium sp.]|nr:hypothetical protein [Rhizomicrobium sp.]